MLATSIVGKDIAKHFFFFLARYLKISKRNQLFTFFGESFQTQNEDKLSLKLSQ